MGIKSLQNKIIDGLDEDVFRALREEGADRGQLRGEVEAGLTSTGGASDRIRPMWLPLGDLVRDRAYDVEFQ